MNIDQYLGIAQHLRPMQLIALVFVVAICFSCGKSNEADADKYQDRVVRPKTEAQIEEEIFNLLTDWLRSQNEGDYDRYQSFYADTFKGIKRAGAKAYEFDYLGWLADRKRMFRKPMNVEAKFIQINKSELPYRIIFQQLWSSGAFSDFGAKVIMVNWFDEELKIIGEEMIASRLMSITDDTNNALNHPNFFIREGPNLLLQRNSVEGIELEAEKYCIKDSPAGNICVMIHSHQFRLDSLSDSDFDLLNKSVVVGDITSGLISYGMTREYRSLREEILDSLTGIFIEGSIFDTDYSWVGGLNRFSDFRSVLNCDVDEAAVARGQWGYISEIDPIVYSKKEIVKDSLDSYLSKMDMKEKRRLVLFTSSIGRYLISYTSDFECGDIYYRNVELWNAMNEEILLVKELPDLPAMILDLDRDGGLDILYEGQFERDPRRYIWWESPYYSLHGADTVFLGCGC